MSGSLLVMLSKGRTRVNERLNTRKQMEAIRKWVKMHESEIRSARGRGYTWREITRSCIELWEHNGEFRGVYMRKDEDLIQVCYYDVQHERKSSHKVKSDEKASRTLRELSGSIRLSED